MIPVAVGVSVVEMLRLTKAEGDFSCLYDINCGVIQITIYQAKTNWNNGWLWCDSADYSCDDIVPFYLKL